MNRKDIICNGRIFEIQSEDKLQTAEIREISKENGISEYKMDFAFQNGTESGDIGITLSFPMKKILQLYSPLSEYKRNRMIVQWFRPSETTSNFYNGLPSLSAVSDGKNNYVTVALSDADNDNAISFCVNDFKEAETVEFRIRLLCGKEPRRRYSVYLRIDEREIPLSETLKEQTEWFYRFYPKSASYPEECDDALYSTWYNFHQHPSADKLYKELTVAKKLGFKTVIIDDGWQYDGNGTSDYIDCGDWAFSKEKFPDPKSFVEKVHALGMKVLLWFPAPFVGFNTKAYAKFKNKLLYERGLMSKGGGSLNAGILDIRYREVRSHIVSVVKELMNYGFDGMKIDFVDSFTVEDETPPYNSDMDTEYVSDSCIKLVQEIHSVITNVNPDAMIEFRQNYVGPNIVRYCNMLRVADCAFDSVTNRIGIADIRMLNYNLAVHSDMLYWAKTETEENIAKQLLNVMFGVPQISVILNEMPESRLDVLKNFIAYWTENRDTLLHGGFKAEGEDCTYSVLTAQGRDKDIVTLYLKNDFEYTGKRTDIFNASRSENVYLNLGDCKACVKVFDIYGKLVYEKVHSGVTKIKIPVGGRAEL